MRHSCKGDTAGTHRRIIEKEKDPINVHETSRQVGMSLRSFQLQSQGRMYGKEKHL